MEEFSVEEAQARFPELIARAEKGESIGIRRCDQWVSFDVQKGGDESPARLTEAGLLAHLDEARVLQCYADAPGHELETKFRSPESSSALAANTFGFFLHHPADLPPLPRLEDVDWPARSLTLEGIARFPWKGGRHPCLDVLIETDGHVIGIESKRYEPFRSKSSGEVAEAYSRPVWGTAMGRYEALRDRVGAAGFRHLDVVQLVKHAFGLRTMAFASGRLAILVYLYAEPATWADGRMISAEARDRHRAEIAGFADIVAGDEVRFEAVNYHQLLSGWDAGDDVLAEHAWQVKTVFWP